MQNEDPLSGSRIWHPRLHQGLQADAEPALPKRSEVDPNLKRKFVVSDQLLELAKAGGDLSKLKELGQWRPSFTPHAFHPVLFDEDNRRVYRTPEGVLLPKRAQFTDPSIEGLSYFVDYAQKEVGCYAIAVRLGDGDILVLDSFLIEQKVMPAQTAMTTDGQRYMYEEISKLGEAGIWILDNIRVWAHSHVYGPTSNSARDFDQVWEWKLSGMPWVLRVIVNKHGRLECTYFDFENGYRIDDLEWVVTRKRDPAVAKAYAEEFVAKVRVGLVAENNLPSYPNAPWSGRGRWDDFWGEPIRPGAARPAGPGRDRIPQPLPRQPRRPAPAYSREEDKFNWKHLLAWVVVIGWIILTVLAFNKYGPKKGIALTGGIPLVLFVIWMIIEERVRDLLERISIGISYRKRRLKERWDDIVYDWRERMSRDRRQRPPASEPPSKPPAEGDSKSPKKGERSKNT